MRRSVIETAPRQPLGHICVFTGFAVLTATCIGVLFFVFNEITIPNIINAAILVFVISIWIVRDDRLGWFGVETGSAANALVFFISYCFVVSDYSVNYMYAFGFALSLGMAGFFASVPVQEVYGLEKGPDRLEKEDFPHITKEEVE